MNIELDTIHNTDALTLLRALPDNSIDLIVTDPPYGVNKAEWDASFPTDWIQEAWRVTRKMLVMPGNTNLILAGNVIGKYKDCVCLYAVNGMTRSAIAFGNYIPVLACGDWRWEARPNLIKFTVSLSEEINHPSPKPLQAIEKLLSYYTKPGDVILDPFMGSGTTAIAARNLDRHFIGCDISAEYVAIANKRLQDTDPYRPTVNEAAGITQRSLFEGVL